MITMSKRGLKRAKVMEMVKERKMIQREAAERLGLSLRQTKRIYKSYLQGGDTAMNHGLLGKSGNHRHDPEFRESTMALVRDRFQGFKPLFISEKLQEDHGINLRPNTLRLWMMEAGLWEKTRKTGKYRTRRPRKKHFGEMVQMDGSPHDWFGTGEESCLMHMVDDATGVSYGLFDSGETTDVALRALSGWIERYGVPQSIYTDYGSVYFTDREPTLEEQLKGLKPRTQFGRVCDELGIEILYAGSPQAKGRVERANGVQQDRLLSELRYQGIRDREAANRFLTEKYWGRHNGKYGKRAVLSSDYHIPLLEDQELRVLISYRDERKLSADYVVRLDNRLFQLHRNQPVPVKPGDVIQIRTWLDHSVHLYKKSVELSYTEITPKLQRKSA